MFRSSFGSFGSSSSSSSSSTVSKAYRCSGKYSLGQSTSSLTLNDLMKYEDLNIDLKELNDLFKQLDKKRTQKNSNLRTLDKKKRKNTYQSNRSGIESRFREEEQRFAKNIKSIISEKLREKAVQRLDRLISKPKEKRLNKVACALLALIEVLRSCGISTSYEELIKRYKEKIAREYPNGIDGAEEFIKDILEKKSTSLDDFKSKQSIHNKQLGEKLKTTIKELPQCK